jgi:DNA-binding MarR family transcriptional regulator
MEAYPRIFFACHVEHRRDPEMQKKLSAHQASILDHLDDVEPTGLLDLARHMGVTASTMSLNVDRLVRKGYVIRERQTADRRRVNLRLTEAGVRMKEASTVLDPERLAAMLGRLSPEHLEAGIRGLEILAGAAQEEVHSRSRKPREEDTL